MSTLVSFYFINYLSPSQTIHHCIKSVLCLFYYSRSISHYIFLSWYLPLWRMMFLLFHINHKINIGTTLNTTFNQLFLFGFLHYLMLCFKLSLWSMIPATPWYYFHTLSAISPFTNKCSIVYLFGLMQHQQFAGILGSYYSLDHLQEPILTILCKKENSIWDLVLTPNTF